jgi:hypothetical protein
MTLSLHSMFKGSVLMTPRSDSKESITGQVRLRVHEDQPMTLSLHSMFKGSVFGTLARSDSKESLTDWVSPQVHEDWPVKLTLCPISRSPCSGHRGLNISRSPCSGHRGLNLRNELLIRASVRYPKN